VLNASWEDVLPSRGPFAVPFFDGGAKEGALGLAVSLLAPGGILIKDDHDAQGVIPSFTRVAAPRSAADSLQVAEPQLAQT
jgi:hypothetical protein